MRVIDWRRLGRQYGADHMEGSRAERQVAAGLKRLSLQIRHGYCAFRGSIASRVAACQTKTAVTVAICFMSAACTRS